jgi:hypothetical protein
MSIIFLLIISIGICGCATSGINVGAVKTLAKLGQNDKLKQKALRQETANFNKLKNYIEDNKIKKGISEKQAIKKFGEPVVGFDELDFQSWIYKAAESSWFGGEKIYLYFDKKGKLTGWECVDCK